ncbi:MAG TPA: cupin domain-containing protein [Pyrinomonadaceae bacterium]
MKKYQLSFLILALVAAVTLVLARSGQATKNSFHVGGKDDGHILLSPDQMKWGPAPPSLPAGAQLAVLEGDPSKAGVPFTIRAKFPDGYKIPPHWHPTDEKVTVLQGTFGAGLGEKFDPAAGHEMPTGSFALMPKGVRHYAWAIGETVVQVSGTGPFEVNYVNPADDPRKK